MKQSQRSAPRKKARAAEAAGQGGFVDGSSLIPPLTPALLPCQLATRWKVSEKTLERWRTEGIGPVFRKETGKVRYPIDAVVAHERASHFRSTTIRDSGRSAR
jgi:hypothetical protein